jgi:anti-sigma factor RsiW
LTCYLTRRRIGAWLDGALDERRSQTVAAHVRGCAGCSREADALRRLRVLVQQAAAGPAEPDWTGFWPGIVRGIQDRRHAPVTAPASRLLWRPRLALGGALAAGLALTLTLWQVTSDPLRSDAAVVVSSAQTDHPGGSLMVYSPPEKDMVVVWVFDED